MAPKRTKVAGKTAAKKTATKKVVKQVKKAAPRDSASDNSPPLRYTPDRLRPRKYYQTTPSPSKLRTVDSREYPSVGSDQYPVQKVTKRPRSVIEDPSGKALFDTSDSSQYQENPAKSPKRAKTAVKKAPAPDVEDSSSEAAGDTSEVRISDVQPLNHDSLLLGSPHRSAKQHTRRKQPKRGKQVIEERLPNLDSPPPEEPKKAARQAKEPAPPIVEGSPSEASSDPELIPSYVHSDYCEDAPDPELPRPVKRTNTSKKVATDSDSMESSLFFGGLRESRRISYTPDVIADRGPYITNGSPFDHDPVSGDIQKESLPNTNIVDPKGMFSYLSSWVWAKTPKDEKESIPASDVETRYSTKEEYDAPYDGNDHPPRGHPSGSVEGEDENIEEVVRDRSPKLMSEDFELTDATQGRVEDNTMLWIFKDRLDVAEAQQGLRMAMLENDKAPCWDVMQRLDQLSSIQNWLFERGDEFKLGATVAAIKEAYMGGTLKWQPQKVTYWSHGRQLCEPRKLDWDEFMIFCDDNKGWEGFWVEGGPTLEAVRRMVGTAGTMQIGGRHLFLYDPEITLKLPWKSHRWENNFLSKAGARMMDFYRRDLRQLPQEKRFKSEYSGISKKKRLPPLLGVYTTKVVDGNPFFQYCRVVDIEIFGKKMPEEFNERLEWDWLEFLGLTLMTYLIITYSDPLELSGGDDETGLWPLDRLLQWPT